VLIYTFIGMAVSLGSSYSKNSSVEIIVWIWYRDF
jgi:hypothetical protein